MTQPTPPERDALHPSARYEPALPFHSDPTLLLVEDVGSTRQALRSHLSHEGFAVEAADSVGEALVRLERRARERRPPYTAVLCNLHVGSANGAAAVDLAREVRARWPELPFILLAAGPTATATAAFEQAGEGTMLVKLHRLAELMRILRGFSALEGPERD